MRIDVAHALAPRIAIAVAIAFNVIGCGSGHPACDATEAQADLLADDDFRIASSLQAIGNSASFQEERRALTEEHDHFFGSAPRSHFTVSELQRSLDVIQQLKGIDKRYLAATVSTLSNFRVVSIDDNGQRVRCTATLAAQSGDSRSELAVNYAVTRGSDGTVRVSDASGVFATDKNQGFIAPVYAYGKD